MKSPLIGPVRAPSKLSLESVLTASSGPYLFNGGKKECGRQAKYNQPVHCLYGAQQPPAILQEDIGVAITCDRADRIQHGVREVGHGR